MITLLNQPWTERLGWTLLHFLWQGILVAALYALARALAGGRISARGRYAIACASLLAMTAAPVLTYWWLGNSGQAARIGDLTDWGARQLAPRVAYSPVTDPWQRAMPGIVLAWFAGAAACSVRLLMGFISAAALRRSRHAPVLTEWQQALDRLIERMHVSRRVRLLPTDRVNSPSVIGWLRPVILAPVGLLCGLAPEQVEALLAHELAHVRRHDYLVNVLQGIAESLLFYHPAVWWISNQIRAEASIAAIISPLRRAAMCWCTLARWRNWNQCGRHISRRRCLQTTVRSCAGSSGWPIRWLRTGRPDGEWPGRWVPCC